MLCKKCGTKMNELNTIDEIRYYSCPKCHYHETMKIKCAMCNTRFGSVLDGLRVI